MTIYNLCRVLVIDLHRAHAKLQSQCKRLVENILYIQQIKFRLNYQVFTIKMYFSAIIYLNKDRKDEEGFCPSVYMILIRKLLKEVLKCIYN